MSEPRISRRALIAAAAASAVSGACGGGRAPLPGPLSSGRRFAVVGAGIAGLVAAFELERSGAEVVVLEAADDVGGRIRTVRGAPLGGELVADAGAAYLATDDASMTELAETLGVPLIPAGARTPGLQDVVCLDGRPRLREEVVTQPGVAEDLGRVEAALVEQADLAAADDRPAAALLDELGLAPTARRLTEIALQQRHGAAARDLSLAFVAATRSADLAAGDPHALRVGGGAARLVERLLQVLATAPMRRSPVTAIQRRGNGLIVRHGRGQPAEIVVDAVVLTAPAVVAAQIAMPDESTTAALTSARPGPLTSVLMVYDVAAWRERGLSGTAVTDTAVAEVTDSTGGRADEPAVLRVLAGGGRAHDLAGLGRTTGAVKTAIDGCLPGGPLPGGRPAVTVEWATEPTIGTGTTWFAPGELRAARDGLLAVRGGLVIAGEHTAQRPGTLEGAVRSGQRAAAELA